MLLRGVDMTSISGMFVRQLAQTMASRQIFLCFGMMIIDFCDFNRSTFDQYGNIVFVITCRMTGNIRVNLFDQPNDDGRQIGVDICGRFQNAYLACSLETHRFKCLAITLHLLSDTTYEVGVLPGLCNLIRMITPFDVVDHMMDVL